MFHLHMCVVERLYDCSQGYTTMLMQVASRGKWQPKAVGKLTIEEENNLRSRILLEECFHKVHWGLIVYI
jgi:hypothetical protein